MKQTDLDILLREGEGSMLEYKEAFSSSFARDLAAFANSSGGKIPLRKILLGVQDDGTRSVRRNPLIADLLHRIALIEKAGTGIRRMIDDARKHKCPEPKFTVNGFFTATFWPNVEVAHKIAPQVTEQVSEQVGEQVGEQVDEQVTILKFCSTPKQKQEILARLRLSPVYLNFKRHIQPLVEQGFLEMTIPDKPRSSKQRYKTTDLGRKVLAQWSGGS